MLGVVVSQFASQVASQVAGEVSSRSIYGSSVEFFPSVPRPVRVPAPRQRIHRAPNYALRRVVVAALTLVALVIVGALVLLAGPGGRPASASQAEPAHSSAPTVHVAEPGESLWTIAQAHHGDVSIDRYVDALIDLNGGTAIDAGQAVRLP